MLRLLGTVVLLHIVLLTAANRQVKVGQKCSIHTDCNHGENSLAHSRCDEDKATCQCVGGYFGEFDDAVCVRSSLDDVCSSNEFCEAGTLGSECLGGICDCQEEYSHKRYLANGRPICETVVAETPCVSNETCSASYVAGGLVCSTRNLECECKEGFFFSETKSACVKKCKSNKCSECSASNGKCYDEDEDGDCDGCECPTGKTLSEPSDMSTGCDKGLAEIGEVCGLKLSIFCDRSHSKCRKDGSNLGQDHTCQCEERYIAVPDVGGNGQQKCVKKLSVANDPNCATCIKHIGECYDEDADGLRDGCLCPSDRSSSDPERSEKDCDLLHLNVTCTRLNMKVCYHTFNSTASNVITSDDLMYRDATIFVKGHEEVEDCMFEIVGDGSSWCLDLSLKADEYGTCGTKSSRSKNGKKKYENVVKVQMDSKRISAGDFTSNVHCYFEERKIVHTGGKDGAGISVRGDSKLINAGETIKPVLEVSVHNENGKMVDGDSSDGLQLGSHAYIVIKLASVGGTFIRVKALTCQVSDQSTVGGAEAKTVLLIFNGCPTPESYLDNKTKFYNDPKDEKITRSGQFVVFKFEGSSIVYIHCSVAVCREEDQKQCAPSNCTDVGKSRHKRALSTPNDVTALTESVHSKGVKVVPNRGKFYSGLTKNNIMLSDPPKEEGAFSTQTLTIVIIGLVVAVISVTVLALVAIFVIKRSAANYPISQVQTPPSSPVTTIA